MQIVKIAKNRLVDALLKFVLLSAAIHIGIAIGRSIAERTMQHLNYFKLISLDLIMPSLGNNQQNFLTAFLVMILVYCLVFLCCSKE